MKTLVLIFSQALLSGALLTACGSNVAVSGGGDGGQGGGDGGQGGSTTPTGQGGSTTPTGEGGSTTTPTSTPTGPGASLALRKLRIGDTTPGGQPSSTAWKQYGFNLDGKVSDGGSQDLCKPAAGAKASSVYPDGDGGIDNSFGKNVLPMFTTLTPDMSVLTNDFIEEGGYSILFRIEGIDAGATGTFLTGAATAGFPPNQAPQWNGLDVWPVRSSSLAGGDPLSPKCQLTQSTVAGSPGQRVWQSNSTCAMEILLLLLPGWEIRIPVREVRMSALLSDDNTKMTAGLIGGVIDTEQLIGELAKTFGAFDASLCPPSATFESIAQQIRQASDILADGTQDPNKVCDAISIGLGFDAQDAGWGSAYDVAVPPDPCSN